MTTETPTEAPATTETTSATKAPSPEWGTATEGEITIPKEWQEEAKPKEEESKEPEPEPEKPESQATGPKTSAKRLVTRRRRRDSPAITIAQAVASVAIEAPKKEELLSGMRSITGLQWNQIHKALVACGLIDTSYIPLDPMPHEHEVKAALSRAYYYNPRGARCPPVDRAVNVCYRATTSCIHAKLIAVIYELTDHNPSRENIDAMNFATFRAMYGDLILGDNWCGIYPLFMNACYHIRDYSHSCFPHRQCSIAHYVRAETLPGNAKERETLEKQIALHMMYYPHPAQTAYPTDDRASGKFQRRTGQHRGGNTMPRINLSEIMGDKL